MSSDPAAPPRPASQVAVVIGAGGGIGRAIVERLVADGRYGTVHALSRGGDAPTGAIPGCIDIGDEATIAAAAGAIPAPIDRIVVATGTLHEDGRLPERALRELDPDVLACTFRINTIGPALVLKHFAPLLARGSRAEIAFLSARVGSISDNRSGGWYGYRASKAALNMIVRCAAIELGRVRPELVCVGLHPGTVDTDLSRPFQARVAPEKLFTPAFSAERLMAVLDGLHPEDSGDCFAWDGERIEP